MDVVERMRVGGQPVADDISRQVFSAPVKSHSFWPVIILIGLILIVILWRLKKKKDDDSWSEEKKSSQNR